LQIRYPIGSDLRGSKLPDSERKQACALHSFATDCRSETAAPKLPLRNCRVKSIPQTILCVLCVKKTASDRTRIVIHGIARPNYSLRALRLCAKSIPQPSASLRETKKLSNQPNESTSRKQNHAPKTYKEMEA
jgi:hypothetical protein